MEGRGKIPEGLGRAGRGAALLAAYKSVTARGDVRPIPGVGAASSEPEETKKTEVSVLAGRGNVLQSIIAGRGRGIVPTAEVKLTPPVLGRGSPIPSPATLGRGLLPIGRAKSFSSSGSSSSSSVSMASPASSAVTPKPSPSPPISEMEELSFVGQYSGTSGQKVELEVNYIKLVIPSGKGVYEYHVSFQPTVESRNMLFRIMNQPEVKAVVGLVRSFDGAKLYLPRKLDAQVTIPSKLPTDNSDVTVCIKYVNECKPRDLIHLYNVLFRRIMAVLKMVQVGRNYFDPKGGIPVPQHRLEIWPGYVTAVQEFEGGVMLQADASFRVLRTITAREVMQEAMSKPNGKEDVERLLIGCVVLTRYNNKTYKVDDISWDQNPKSSFTTHDGSTISYCDYYKKAYDIEIQDKGQPLLLSCSKKRNPDEKEKILCLIPELCHMTGLTDSMRSDHKIMRDIATHTRVQPAKRQLCFEKFINNINDTPEAKKVLADWNLELSERPVTLSGRVLKSEDIILGKKNVTVPPEADWGRLITNTDVLVPVNIETAICIFTRRDASKVQEFITMMKKCSPSMGIRLNQPKMVELANDRTESYCQALRSNINPNVQVAIIIFPNPRDDRYSAVKKVCCIEMPIPSQCVNVRTISNYQRLRSVCQKIILQINCKLGGELWALKIPIENVMVCGFDTYHDAAQRKQSILGFVVSINRSLTRWYSQTATQKAGQEMGDNLRMLFITSLKKYHQINHSLPQKIFIFRDGVSDGMLDVVSKYEVVQLQACFKDVQADYSPTLSVIVVQKRINTRMYLKSNNTLSNPPPGSILDHDVTRKSRYDFFLVSQHVGQGTVSPTHFIVVSDNSPLKPEHMQRLTYKMTHMYYNWPGTIRVPAPCQYAHKLAYLVGQNLHKEAHGDLADKLFYL